MAANTRQHEGPISVSSILSRRVNRFRDDSDQKIYDTFVPQDNIQSLTERDKVELTLNEELTKPEDILALTEYVVGKAKKVFLLLIYSDTIKYIRDLQTTGFTDEDLPVIMRESEDGSSVSVHRWRAHDTSTYAERQSLTCFSSWTEPELEDFLEKQWIFLAPVFARNKFAHVLYSRSPLPYMRTQGSDTSSGEGHFGTIRKRGLHNGHHKYQSLIKDEGTGRHIAVAVKTLNNQGSAVTDVEKFYTKESETLEKMKNLGHRHLIKAVAAYRKGPDRCFVFPWAQEGSLRDFWRNYSASLNEGLVSWAIEQMVGLSDGLRELHKDHTRHGDLKPDNILCFTSGNERTLVLADVGLAKYHPEYTRDRTKATTTRHGSRIYEPPEMSANRGNIVVSRKYDIWSLGCVFLEFTIWLLYGRSGLASFRNTLLNNPDIDRFWQNDTDGKPKIHPVARNWLDKILAKDLQGVSALRDLVRLIVKRLLVPDMEERADAEGVFPELDTIRRNSSGNHQYLFNSELEELAKQRGGSDFIAEDDMPHPSREYPRTSLLHGQWRNVTDNESARTIISHLDWPSLRLKADASGVCHYCATLGFQLPTLDLHRSIEELRSGSDECSLCHFLFRCLSKVKPKPEEPVRLFRDDSSHALRVLPSSAPVISIYSDTVSRDNPPSYAQLGLPILPELGSQQQFKLLNEWINLCDTTHNCTSVQGHEGHVGSMPTRVLHVGTVENPCLRLVETGDSIRDKYIALSHCWGKLSKEQKFVTSADNLDNRKEDIPFDEMPKSFQDAVIVTRDLGVSYLWIDSLCIIQEDEADWEVESAKMEEVFSSAYCTIAASSAQSSLEGFLGDRVSRACVTIHLSQGPVLYLAEAIDDFQGHVEQSVLNSRGWVLQERALSRRTIHFTSTQTYWECGQGIYCETLARLQNPQSQFLGDSSFPYLGLQYYKDERIQLVQHLYRVYCALELTNSTDRSKAILGLQKRLSRTFKSGADYGVIWGYFERTLLWQAKTPNSLSRIPYRDRGVVPSWSWMACTGEIQYMDIPFRQVSWTGNPTNPIESVSEGEEWDGQLTAEASQLLVDEDELSRRAVIDCSTFTFDSAAWRCIVVGKSKVADESGDVVHYVLLIRPLGGLAQVYERVGVGILLGAHISRGTTRVYLR
ncbi:Protein kinase domain-containing protein [Fusarium falciforme]|uniref:Protein kinase domain-containing protein n=1 Tax=Fusarium falciforme TaxID=195108 RepID=UPI002300C78F|nr:Protein kinase domain-containing protein [Fusarium falciforme]WAO87250.1 Protein kinase domain-containing protein [Fusarium falciforme]